MGIFNKTETKHHFQSIRCFFIVCFYFVLIFYLLLPAISDIFSLFVSPLVQNTEIYNLVYIN